MEFTTLCYLEQDGQYLMLHRTKKELDFNKDKWIGLGGHLEPGEGPDQCLLREVMEETGLTLTSWRMRGILLFEYRGISEYTFLYTADGFEGEMGCCSEGELEWIPKERLLSLGLFEGDLIFFQLLQENAPFFCLKLVYEESRLVSAVLDDRQLELLDITDESGNPTGLTRERTLCHLLGTPHRTAHVWIARPCADGFEVLLQKRSHDKDSYPDCYDISSAGHVPAGWGLLESALRELKEELGIEAAPEELVPIGSHTGTSHSVFYGKPFHNCEISMNYLYTGSVCTEDLVLQAEEIQSVHWMNLDAVIKEVSDGNPDYCLYADELAMLSSFLNTSGFCTHPGRL